MAWILMRDYGFRVGIMGQNLKAAKNLYRIIETFFKFDPYVGGQKMEAHNRAEIRLPNDGEAVVASADAKDTLTSQTYQVLILTEPALWPGDASEQMRSLEPMVSDDDWTFIVWESTARGVGDFFHTRWKRAVDGTSGYRPMFVGWTDIEKYETAFAGQGEKDDFLRSLDADEMALLGELGGGKVTLEKLKWRRACLSGRFDGREDLFDQEFPLNSDVAFLTTGRAVFDQGVLGRWAKAAREPIWRGVVRWMNHAAPWREMAEKWGDAEFRVQCFEPMRSGEFRVWAWPERWTDYEIGCDVSEGRTVKDKKTDETCFYVMRSDTADVVAEWYGKIPPSELADVLACVGWAYNEAFVCVEANNMGGTTTARLSEIYNRIRIYTEEREAKSVMMRGGVARYGYYTDSSSKKHLIEMGAYQVRYTRFACPVIEVIKEMSESKTEDNGKVETTGRDRLMALLLTLEAHRRAFPHSRRPTMAISGDVLSHVSQTPAMWKSALRREAALQQMSVAQIAGVGGHSGTH